MLELVELEAKAPKKSAYKERRKELMQELVLLQQQARQEQLGLVVLFEGWNSAGKGSRISDLLYLMDARSTNVVHTVFPPYEDAELFTALENGVTGYKPFMEPFWQGLGERGTITFYEQGWYATAESMMLAAERARWKSKARHRHSHPRVPIGTLVQRAFEPLEELGGASRADTYLDAIASWEKGLVDDGYLVLKFFVHISKAEQRHRMEELFENPDTRWRVSDEELMRCAEYNDIYELHDEVLKRSNYEFAPWVLVNGEDKRIANLQVAQTMVDTLRKGLAAKAAAREAAAAETPKTEAPLLSAFPICTDHPDLDEVDHTLKLEREDYEKQLKHEQKRLAKLELEMYLQSIPLVVMYEGWDAAGKGGAIKRVAQALDARAYHIFPSPAPTPLELAHPHLWRYWTRLPKAGHVGIYDRSWYGRVLVERVEGFASPQEWQRAYDEINAFERDLVDWGAILVKFWVEVHPDEQLRRFQERQDTPEKQWKITPDDWRNREKNPQYYQAVQDMFRLTSTTYAPWTLLESDDKLYARIKSLRTINEALEKRLKL